VDYWNWGIGRPHNMADEKLEPGKMYPYPMYAYKTQEIPKMFIKNLRNIFVEFIHNSDLSLEEQGRIIVMFDDAIFDVLLEE
jgi:hypothetical protein